MVRIRILVVACVAVASLATADVFWRFRRAPSTLLSQMGGRSVFTSEATINQRPGTVSVYTFENQPPAALTRQLVRQAGCSGSAGRGGTALLTAVEQGVVRRMVVLPDAERLERSTVISFEQSMEGAQAGKASWPAGSVVNLGTPRFSAMCAATRTLFVTAEMTGTPQAALDAARMQLVQAGWAEMPVSTPVFSLFVKGLHVSTVYAGTDSKSGATVISVLQREGASR